MAVADLLAGEIGPHGWSDDDLKRIAVHEAGHAVAALVLGCMVEGASVRGFERGGPVSIRLRNRLRSSTTVREELIIVLSGRAAEEIFFDEPSAGAGGVVDARRGIRPEGVAGLPGAARSDRDWLAARCKADAGMRAEEVVGLTITVLAKALANAGTGIAHATLLRDWDPLPLPDRDAVGPAILTGLERLEAAGRRILGVEVTCRAARGRPRSRSAWSRT